ncbi:unnamed protein product [Aphanomyces euteiches]
MDPRRQEDPNLGPTRTEAYNADTDMEPPSTNAVTESANVAYTESPLATLRKRDLEYRRLLHANSPDQRDPEKRSRSLPAEPNDDSMVSNSGSDLTPLPALDANAAKQSDLSDCLAEDHHVNRLSYYHGDSVLKPASTCSHYLNPTGSAWL